MLATLILAGVLSTAAVSPDLSGFAAIEGRVYPDDALNPGQTGSTSSFVFQPELYWQWDDGDNSITFTPFLRTGDKDDARDHADIRELMWINVQGDWETRLGIGRVFWGVTESQHLVDVINQIDLVESPDAEDKLGQPMLNITRITNVGTWDLFILPGFRERTFPGVKGRLRTGLVVDTDQDALYESPDRDKHLDWALRWSHYIGDVDIGISHFSGTSRAPVFVPGLNSLGEPVLIPRYDLIEQTGLALQAIAGDWLWKLETISTEQRGARFIAMTGGFEYTYVGLFDSSMDLGMLAEYLYDSRDASAPGPFEDDLMLGLRWVLNDAQSTEVLLGVIYDLDGEANNTIVEASRRLGNRWKLELEYRGTSGVEATDPLYLFRMDGYVQLTLARYF